MKFLDRIYVVGDPSEGNISVGLICKKKKIVLHYNRKFNVVYHMKLWSGTEGVENT